MQADFVIHSDGASRKDGRGGWGVTILNTSTGERQDFCGGEYDTTNNRMELMGAIEGMKRVPPGATVDLISDSQYVVLGMSENLGDWERRGWRTSTNQPLKNLDLWQELIAISQDKAVAWLWVRGHIGEEGNERADRLAGEGVPDAKVDEEVDSESVPGRLLDARARGIKRINLYEDDDEPGPQARNTSHGPAKTATATRRGPARRSKEAATRRATRGT